MKTVKLLLVSFAFLLVYGTANAQLGNIRRAVQRGVERAVEKKAEQKAEEAVNQAIDKSLEKAEEQRALSESEIEKALDNVTAIVEEMQNAQDEADDDAAMNPDEIREVSNTPYTPSESEFAFFAMKKGAQQVFATKDAKGKITSQIRNTIEEITGTKNAFAIAYESEVLDAEGKATNEDNPLILNYRIIVKDGIMYLDMKEMFSAMDGFDGMQVSGTAMKIPNNLVVGQTLDDASAKVKIGFINSSTVMTEGKCLAIEDMTVEAGTFRCYKITQKSKTSVMGIKAETTTLTWYAKGVGAVKTEIYDKKGKLQSVQELIANR